MKKIGSVAVQKMYRRFKNRVLRKKGVEEKKKCLPKLISSEPLTDLRCEASSVVALAADSMFAPSRPVSSMVQDAVSPATQATTPSCVLTAEPSCIGQFGAVSCTTINTATSLRPARQDGVVCSIAAPTPSSSSSTMNTDTITESRARLHGMPTPHPMPMLSADSGVEVDCCIDSCGCSCADVDDVFTDDEEELVDDDGWRIAAHDLSLDKVLHESSCETVYR